MAMIWTSVMLTVEEIREAQRRLVRRDPLGHSCPRTRMEWLSVARWWDLEAERGYTSAAQSRRYAANCRWCAALAHYKPGSFRELIEARWPGRVDEVIDLITDQDVQDVKPAFTKREREGRR
jgi:hypothetical protein